MKNLPDLVKQALAVIVILAIARRVLPMVPGGDKVVAFL